MSNLFTLYCDVNTKEQAVEYLQSKNILHQQRVCRKGHVMALTLSEKNDRWRCNTRSCHLEVGLRVETWLEGSELPLEKVVWFIYSWCLQYTNTKFCNDELGMDSETATMWKSTYMREVCAKSLLQNPNEIGGEGMSVEIDEASFNLKGAKSSRIRPQQWVFGGVCRETKDCFLYAVPDPSYETLYEAVTKAVKPGSTVICDLWKSYEDSGPLPPNYTHFTINQSTSDAKSGGGKKPSRACAIWSTAKRFYTAGESVSEQETNFCEYLWRKRFENVVLVDQFYEDVVSIYPLTDAMK